MFEIQDFESYQKLLDEKQTFLLYGKQVNCSVCMADFPKVERIDFTIAVVAAAIP